MFHQFYKRKPYSIINIYPGAKRSISGQEFKAHQQWVVTEIAFNGRSVNRMIWGWGSIIHHSVLGWDVDQTQIKMDNGPSIHEIAVNGSQNDR